MNTVKQLIDPAVNMCLATACVPDDYVIGGQLTQKPQSDVVRFTFSTHAVNSPKGILMLGFSEELYNDVHNGMVKQMLKLNPGYIEESYRPYTEPAVYLKQLAESVFQAPLQETAVTQLPISVQPEVYANRINGLANEYASMETAGGTQCNVLNTTLQPLLFRYTGIGPKDGRQYTVLCGGIFEGFELTYPTLSMINPFGGLGGLFGKKNAGNDSRAGGSGFGYEKCDFCFWGSFSRFLLITPAENQDEALSAFGEYITTWQINPEILQRADQMRAERYQLNMQTAMNAQAQTQRNIANNMFQQQKLNNMLRENSQSISAGLMDSWNRKMASESRMSDNFSQAIRGVDTYVGTDGRPVEVSVSADHVYQNPNGTTYGVSGSAPDQEILNKLNWTELNKKQ